jgi:spermidine/putrescine transport system substrate-binding protein
MFLGLGILFSDKLTSDEFKADANYSDNIQELMNDTSEETVEDCEEVLKSIKDVAYSFETDSGKADMVTGKVYANYQWSGDAVYTMDQAEEDDVYLNYSVPEECSNLWFDGWVMLKSGINGDSDRQQAAEAFINFISRPDNAVRNMYYIGYTSTISGGDDDTILEYVDWCYSADEDEEDVVDYDISYFFDDEAVITCSADQLNRQLAAQYPTEEVMERCAVMWYFDSEANSRINQMWINVRCFNVEDAVGPLLILVAVILVITGVSLIYFHRHRVFNIKKK